MFVFQDTKPNYSSPAVELLDFILQVLCLDRYFLYDLPVLILSGHQCLGQPTVMDWMIFC